MSEQSRLELVIDSTGAARDIRTARSELQGLERAGDSAARTMKVAGVAIAASATAAAGTLALLTRQGLNFVDSQAKLSQQLDTSIDDLRALQIAAEDVGIASGQLESSLRSYTKRLGDSVRGTGEARQAFEALGLEAAELAQMPLADQLALIAERISRLDSAAERTSIADRLMSGGRQMVNLFEAGGDAIEAAVREVDEFGLSLSRVDAAKVEQANDALGRIPRVLEPIRNQLAITLAEPLTEVAGLFNEAARESNGFAAEVAEGVAMAADTVAALAERVDGVRVAMMRVQRVQLQAEAFGGTINRIITGRTDDTPEAFNQLARLEQDIARITDGDTAFSQIGDAFREQAQQIRDNFAARQAERDIIEQSNSAHQGLVDQFVGPLHERVSEMVGVVREANDATEDQTEELEEAAGATRDFADTVRSSAATIAQAISVVDPRYDIKAGGDTIEERARSRFEASAFRVGESSVTNFGGNPDARPTTSLDYLSTARGSTESLLGATGGGRVGDESSQDPVVQQLVQANSHLASLSQGGGEGRSLGTLTLASDGGKIDVEANAEELSKWLADTLSGAAASV